VLVRKRAAAALVVVAAAWAAWWRWHVAVVQTDVLVIGAGIGGLSAAYEAGRGGASVAVAEMNSVFGGNGVLSEGGLFIVDTPLQQSVGLHDSAAQAESDIRSWGEDADPEWARILARDSRREIYDWLSGLGVQFFAVRPQAGNHVPRFHENREKGLGLLRAIYRECLRAPRTHFYFNTRIEGLTVESGRVTGATGVSVRNGRRFRFRASSVVLATGGFQGNEKFVRAHWHTGWPQPERLLMGASPNSSGAGLEMGLAAGAATHRMDHQWHYPFGIPDPRLPGENRAVSVRNLNAIWVNAQGKRFVNEWKGSRYTIEAVVRQNPANYWMVFDRTGVADLRYSGTDWSDPKRAKALLLDNPAITATASTWAELAARAGLPAEELQRTVERYNAQVRAGQDADFQRFGKQALPEWLQVFPVPQPRQLLEPPFYAMHAFPMTRKNMGGLRTDTNCRVLTAAGNAIPGLYAVGEVAGLGGVNGKAGLEGTFLGPSLIQGRRAGRFLTHRDDATAPPAAKLEPVAEIHGGDAVCRTCHTLPMRFFGARNGYRHFRRAHQLAEERRIGCRQCHAEVDLARPWLHRIRETYKTASCSNCHLPWTGPAPATR
jgi:predicted oxidoreductase